jgi:MoaA/NifB/PqqE/SkfB family radical SAM enzyme
MNAVYGDLFSKNRKMLHEIIPLETPFTFSIEPITFCNLKCNFCIYSLSKEEMLKAGHVFSSMTMDTFLLLIEQLKQFSSPIKSFTFVGEGEPLLHNDLPFMVEQLSNNKLSDNIRISTNGLLLSHDLSSKLIHAGVNTFKISVNGLSEDDYLKNCGVKIDFDNFLSELHYLNENKGNTKILIKTLSSVLKDKDEKDFFKLFGDCCDKISIENTMPYIPGVSYDDIIDKGSNNTSRFSGIKRIANICSAPFFRMSVKYNGAVKVCGCRSGIIVDNNINNLYKSWNGEAHKKIMLKVLKEDYNGITDFCNECFSRNDFAFEEDNLDPYVDKVYEKIINL